MINFASLCGTLLGCTFGLAAFPGSATRVKICDRSATRLIRAQLIGVEVPEPEADSCAVQEELRGRNASTPLLEPGVRALLLCCCLESTQGSQAHRGAVTEISPGSQTSGCERIVVADPGGVEDSFEISLVVFDLKLCQ